MAKYSENQRAEAYRIYMSDSLSICNKLLSRGELTMPRYYDLTQDARGQKEERSPDDIIASVKNKANALRGETE